MLNKILMTTDWLRDRPNSPEGRILNMLSTNGEIVCTKKEWDEVYKSALGRLLLDEHFELVAILIYQIAKMEERFHGGLPVPRRNEAAATWIAEWFQKWSEMADEESNEQSESSKC